MNALHMNSLLDQKAVGSPVTSSCLYRRTCSSTSESTRSSVVKCSHSHVRESSSTAIMNKENRCRERAFSDSGERAQHQLTSQQHKSVAQINSTRYKTELCRPFEENGSCKYGEKCQFAHGYHELRSLSRHPKYKTEPCRTFHTIGFCPYGPRCHFIHNAEERRAAPADTSKAGGAGGFRPKLHHSLSFSGFSNHHHGLDSPTSRTPPPASSSSFYDDVMSPGSVTRCLSNSAFSFPGPNSAYVTQSGVSYYGNLQLSLAGPPSPPYGLLNPLSESPVFDSPPSPPDSLSDRDSYASGSLSSTGSLSGSESPSLDGGRRLPIFSRLSISDD